MSSTQRKFSSLIVSSLFGLSIGMKLCIFPQGVHAEDWSDHARRFTGESDLVKEEVIQKIRETPDLENTLRKVISGQSPAHSNEKKFLALDTIAALKLYSLLPDLTKLSEHDESGYFYHAMNALFTTENRRKLIELYRGRLFQENTSPASKMALLDTLARLQSSLTEDQLKALLSDPHFEVQSAALSYIRHWVIKLGQSDYLPLVQATLQKKIPFQLKFQALYFVSELSPRYRRSTQTLLRHCKDDLNPEVRALCLKLLGGTS
jgi:hypothetical protein